MKLRTCILAALTLSACYGDVCVEFFDGKCPSEGGAAGTAGTGGGGSNPGGGGDGGIGGSGGNAGGGGEGGTGGTNPGCEPDAEAIGDDCGVFVSNMGTPNGPGTKMEPLSNLAAAIEAADGKDVGSKNVYICGTFSNGTPISLPDGVNIYGRRDCQNWTLAARGIVPLLSNGNAVATPVVTVEGASTMYGVSVAALDASDANPGSSSIGILVRDGGALNLSDSVITASNGAPGENGATPSAAILPASNNGNDGKDAVCDGGDGTAVFGGDPVVCELGGTAGKGGDGGSGSTGTTGSVGNVGEAASTGNSPGGAAGAAQSTASCTDPGDVGGDGDPGLAAQASSFGSLSNSGYSPSTSGNGTAGTPGGGGGGGGGGRSCSNNSRGPGGGGGGSGGCGGAGGTSGQGGGASFGIVLLGNATLAIQDTSITSGNGGDGGDGAVGQTGNFGGSGGAAQSASGTASCQGGAGGRGGQGGPGAGGFGGPSAAIARTSAATINPGSGNTLMAGNGGGLGMGAMPGGPNGEIGASCDLINGLVVEGGTTLCE